MESQTNSHDGGAKETKSPNTLCVPKILIRLSDDHDVKSKTMASMMRNGKSKSSPSASAALNEDDNWDYDTTDQDDLEILRPTHTVLQLSLLETCSIYLLSNHILSAQDFKETLSKKVQTRVLEVSVLCACSIWGSSRDIAFAIDSSGMVLCFNRDTVREKATVQSAAAKATKLVDQPMLHFSRHELFQLPHFLPRGLLEERHNRVALLQSMSLSSSSSSNSQNPEALLETRAATISALVNPIMYADEPRGMVVIVSTFMIYIISIDFKSLVAGVGDEAVLGAVSFPSPNSYSMAHIPLASASQCLPLPQEIVEFCSVWGQTGREIVVCSGSGNWIDIWPLAQSPDDDVWELATPSYKPYRFTTNHDVWITAISKSKCLSSFHVTGDANGCLNFWICNENDSWMYANGVEREDEVAGNDCLQSSEVAFDAIGHLQRNNQDTQDENRKAASINGPVDCVLSVANVCSDYYLPITSIAVDEEGKSLWIGDESRTIVCAYFDAKRRRLEKLRKVSLSALAGPSELQWVYKSQLKEGYLRAIYQNEGIAYECILHDNVSNVMSVWPDLPFGPGHRSVVEVCAVVIELDLIIVAGYGNAALVWDLNTCSLLCTIPCPHRFFTSLAASPISSSSATIATLRVVSGHASGHANEYILTQSKATNRDNYSNDDAQKREAFQDGESVIELLESNKHFETIPSATNSSLLLPPQIHSALHALEADKANERRPIRDAGEKEQYNFQSSFVCSTEYCPLPVSDIVISTLGNFIAICYARLTLIIHSCTENKALRQFQFDNFLCHISQVSSTDQDVPPSIQDSLILALQGPKNLKLLDCLTGEFLTQFDLEQGGGDGDGFTSADKSIACSGVWDSKAPGVDGMRQVSGLCANHGGRVFSFGHSFETRYLVRRYAPDDQRVHLDDIMQGLRVFNADQFPLATIWNLRKLTILRINLLADRAPQILKMHEFHVPDEKTRIILSCSLKLRPRAHANKAVTVLSDGTCIVLIL